MNSGDIPHSITGMLSPQPPPPTFNTQSSLSTDTADRSTQPSPVVLDMSSVEDMFADVAAPSNAQHPGRGGIGSSEEHSNQQQQQQQQPSQSATPTQPRPQGLQMNLLKGLETYIPFILLLLAKSLYGHRLGFLMFIFLQWTFWYADSTYRKYVTPRVGEPHSRYLVWIIVYVTANILLINYVFQDQLLYQSLYMMPPPNIQMDMWTLLWRVGITDFTLKYITIVAKACVTLIPSCVLSYKIKGKYYMLIENVFQFYRCVVPIVPWYYYLWGPEDDGQWFAAALIVLYFIFKIFNVWGKARSFYESILTVLNNRSYGQVPSAALLGSNSHCAICHDVYTDAVELSCKHIFCEECITMWFDRERTCPMCRTPLKSQPMYRDGSTSTTIQFF